MIETWSLAYLILAPIYIYASLTETHPPGYLFRSLFVLHTIYKSENRITWDGIYPSYEVEIWKNGKSGHTDDTRHDHVVYPDAD